MEFTHQVGDKYIVTGLLYNSTRRFRSVYENPHYALAVNLWRGSVWQQGPSTGGKRKLLKRVFN